MPITINPKEEIRLTKKDNHKNIGIKRTFLEKEPSCTSAPRRLLCALLLRSETKPTWVSTLCGILTPRSTARDPGAGGYCVEVQEGLVYWGKVEISPRNGVLSGERWLDGRYDKHVMDVYMFEISKFLDFFGLLVYYYFLGR